MPRILRFAFACLAFVVLTLAAAPPASADPFGLNLIVNGNAEAGAGSPDGFTVVPAPGFTTTGNFTVARYGSNAGIGLPTASSPGPPDRGINFFAGGPNNAFSSATQFIDVSLGASSIDAGTTTFDLSAYLGGSFSEGDNAILSVSFLNAASGVLGTATLGPVTAANRGNVVGLLLRTTSGGVPVGTRGINVTLNMTRTDGAYNNAYADNLSLVLSANNQNPPPSAVPEPATMILLGTGLAGVAAKVRRRRKSDDGA